MLNNTLENGKALFTRQDATETLTDSINIDYITKPSKSIDNNNYYHTKIVWNDFESIIIDEDYENYLLDENYTNKVIEKEVQNIKDLGYKVIKQGKDFIIIEGVAKPEFKYWSTNCINQCNIDGKLNNDDKIKYDNDSKVIGVKAKVIVKYFQEKSIDIVSVKEDKNIIVFNCPICKKGNGKMYIYINSFHVGTHSKSDCVDDKHQQFFAKTKKALKKLWDGSKEKRETCFYNHPDYFDKIIKERFPAIIKDKDGIIYLYNETKKHYTPIIENDRIDELTQLIQNTMFNDCGCLLSATQIKEAKTYIKFTYKFPVKDFTPCYLYNCANGVLNLISGELAPHSKEYFFNYCSTIEYNPKADTTKLYNFIDMAMTEENNVELLSKILGHIHYQGEKLQKGFIFFGTKRGRNGKGTLVKLIKKVIGEERTIEKPLDEFKDFGAVELKDKALYIEDDYKQEYIKQEQIGFLNKLISRLKMNVRVKNKSDMEFIQTAIPIIQCNKIPKLKADDDGGFYGRWVQINFKNCFIDKMNEFLGIELLEDKDVMSSMLNLLMNGYRLLLDRKKTHTTKNFFKEDEKNIDWKEANNPIAQFVKECCVLGENYKISSRDLYLHYKNEWNLGGAKVAENKFGMILKEDYDIKKKLVRDSNGKQKNMLIGLTCDDIVNDDIPVKF